MANISHFGEKMTIVVSSTECQNSFGKYLEIVQNEEVVITKNGKPYARLVSEKKKSEFLSDRLVGVFDERGTREYAPVD